MPVEKIRHQTIVCYITLNNKIDLKMLPLVFMLPVLTEHDAASTIEGVCNRGRGDSPAQLCSVVSKPRRQAGRQPSKPQVLSVFSCALCPQLTLPG